MLPFTKRPGREESSDVVAKEALSPASASRPSSIRQNEETQLRDSAPDVEDDRTGLHSAKALSSGYPAPIPAAGRPATMPPPSLRAGRGVASPSSIRPGPSSAPGSMRPPPSSGRGSLRPPPAPVIAYEGIDDDAEDEDGGRTVVKAEAIPGRVVRRKATPSQVPATASSSTSVAPAAIIRKTQDSVRASQRPGMLAPPPADPVEDEYTHAPARSSRRETPSSARSNYPPMSYEGPPSHRPPPRSDRADVRMDSTQSSRRAADSFDDEAPPPSRSFAPPPSSSARNDHFGGGSGLPGPFARTAPSTFPQQTQAPYQQTMDVTGESGSSGYHTGPPPASSSQMPMQMHHPSSGMMHDHTGGSMGGMGGGHLGHANTMPAHMMNHGSAPPAPMSAHPAAMPAHFRLAQTGAITPQRDPPALTSSNLRSSSRPAISWAMALAAAGVFVGVVAVAITQREPPPVDPQAQLAAQPAVPIQPAQPAQPAVAPTNALPPGLLGASPNPGPNPGVLPGNPNAAAPPAGGVDPNAPPQGGVAFAPVPVTKTPRTFAAAPGPKKPATPRPTPKAGDDDDDDTPPKKAPVTKKGPKDPDEETRKALEALQKAQLESSSSFSKP